MEEEQKKRGITNPFLPKKHRELYLFDEVNSETVRTLIEEFRELDRDKKKRPIHLLMNSPGGDLSSGFALIDVILNSKCDVYTYAFGEICSMAPAIFVAGDKRFITEHTYVMLHPVSGGAIDYVEFMKSRIKNIEAAEKMYDDYFMARVQLPKKLYDKAKYTELWLTSQEALKYKIATDVYKG